MSLLQDPIRALAQAEWYLGHANEELFPGAFEVAAGNICRQTLEQALLVACFFSGMPRARFVKMDGRLHTAGRLLSELGKIDQAIGQSYWVAAGRRGSRIRKITRRRNELHRHARLLNEPSHFSLRYRAVGSATIRQFIELGRLVFDSHDGSLLVAILNDVLSHGRFTATLGPEPENTPCIMRTTVVTAHDLGVQADGRLALLTREESFAVASSENVPRGQWPRVPIIVEHSAGIQLGTQFITRRGHPVDMSNFGTLLRSIATTRGERSYLRGRLRKLGFEIEFGKPTGVPNRRLQPSAAGAQESRRG